MTTFTGSDVAYEETFSDDHLVWPALTELVTCLCSTIEERGLPDLCFCGLVPGEQVAWDYVGASGGDGMAWVRLMNVYPSTTFPTTDSTLRSCASPLAAQVELGILRCAPMPGDDGTPPSMAAQWEATRLQMADMRALYAAVKCCYAKHKDAMVLGQYAPAGPAGGVVGGTWQVWLGAWQGGR